jgi:hypothetical protein
MLFQEMNIDALKRTLDLMLGPQGSEVVAIAYQGVAAAMQAAYNEGYLTGEENGIDLATGWAREGAEEALEAASHEGFDQGHDHGYDEGYVNGVADARARPAIADETVQDIINDAAENAINGEVEVEQLELGLSDGAIYAAVSERDTGPVVFKVSAEDIAEMIAHD